MARFQWHLCGTRARTCWRDGSIWEEGMNYGHGTEHGVGHFLNVHEGPHESRMNHMPALLLPGMTVTNEARSIQSREYGVRTENTMLIVDEQTTDFGKFYKFEALTVCLIDILNRFCLNYSVAKKSHG